MSESDLFVDETTIVATISNRQSQKSIGIAVVRHKNKETFENDSLSQCSVPQYVLELFDFIDNAQFSNLDSLLVQMGNSILYLSDEFEDQSKGDGKKLGNIVSGKEIQVQFIKKNLLHKKPDTSAKLIKLCGEVSHNLNVAEVEREQAFSCVEYILSKFGSSPSGSFSIGLGSLSSFMRLDSAASEAVNLLPKPDHPSQFGSLFGILNRCKTKMGTRLLDRWLRQPLLDHNEINNRLDFVEIMKKMTSCRNRLVDETLKSMPDIDLLVSKFYKNNAQLSEIFRMYVFCRSLSSAVTALEELGNGVSEEKDSNISLGHIQQRFIDPIRAINEKLEMYRSLVEHVIDFDKLPDFMVNSKHDPELKSVEEELEALKEQADNLLHQARTRWASFTDVKLDDNNPQHGMAFRTAKGDDERQLRANNKSTGVYFTTPELESIASSRREYLDQYKDLQTSLVEKIVDTARTYLPVFEAASNLVAEIDVLTAFATAAALSPGDYCRPKVHPLGSGILNYVNARHPCVEMMDGVTFIPNSYNMVIDQSNFQIITGPNMGGKSTYIRGIGCLQVMAQIGSFVPAEYAEVAVVDAILARVGAGDAVQKGVSTFMAEMLEASVILQTASKNSLLIIDELGRGTSTFDGYGLAWAISQYIINNIGCYCLFATHFHELTALDKKYSSVVNRFVSAVVEDGQLVMLYSLQDGPCQESFGVHIASMAGFPNRVIEEAKRKAIELENFDPLNADRPVVHDDEAERKFKKSKDTMEKFSRLSFDSLNSSNIRSELNNIV